MDQEPDLIKERMKETRVSLTDKIETLENTLRDTVQSTLSTASHVVEDVEETAEAVKDSVEESAETVKETVASTLDNVKETVVSAFDISGHVRRHPWVMLGGSVVVGYLGGRLALGRRERRRRDRRRAIRESFLSTTPGQPLEGTRRRAPAPPAPLERPRLPQQSEEQPRENGPSWLRQLADTFGGELNALKSLALGATFGVVRDMLVGSVSEPFRTPLADIVNDATTKMGGRVIREPLIEPEHFHKKQRGGENGKQHEAEMGRPLGTTQGPCQTGLG
jgi:ElaB/YqjD/DUF883 family membrane-anchored ribosome-binding protein